MSFRQCTGFIRLSWSDKMLAFYTLLLLGVVRFLLLAVPFRYLSDFLGRHMQDSSAEKSGNSRYIDQVRWVIRVTSRYTPWESNCLVQAISAKMLLRRKRLNNTLYMGLAEGPANNLAAHAWLRCGSDIVTGEEGKDEFTIVAKFTDIFEGFK